MTHCCDTHRRLPGCRLQDSNCSCVVLFASTTLDSDAQLVRVQALLRRAFQALPQIDHLMLPRGPDRAALALPTTLAALFTPVPLPPGTALVGAVSELLLLPREPILPTLHVRPSRVEDHDDLVPVFEAQSDVVRSAFGEYFIAETIERQGDTRRVLVGESPDGRAIGLVALSTDVRADLLNACFHTEQYNGLRKLSPQQVRRWWCGGRRGRAGTPVLPSRSPHMSRPLPRLPIAGGGGTARLQGDLARAV